MEELLIGVYLFGKKNIIILFERRGGNGKFLFLNNCYWNNFKNIDIEIFLGKFVCIIGVFGLGKLILMNELIYLVL